MPSSTHAAALAAVLAVLVPRSAAGQLTLAIADGRVTLEAVDVPAAVILHAWSRLGNTRVEGAERLGSDRVTLRLTSVPEAVALRAVLHAASGFVACERQLAVSGPSRFSRILVLAASTPVPAEPHGIDAEVAAGTAGAPDESAVPIDVGLELTDGSVADGQPSAEDGVAGDRGPEEEDGAQARPLAIAPPSAPSPRIEVPAGFATRPGVLSTPLMPPPRGRVREDR